MGLIDVEKALLKLGRPLFGTAELAALSGTSPSSAVQTLRQMENAGLVRQVRRGLWQDTRREINPYEVVPYLTPNKTMYVSFTSALHLHGIIEQIPQTITVATRGHSATIRTLLGTYRLHTICRELFEGFDWYKGKGNFLIATPEKAFIDCLYIAGRKGNAFASFPELDLVDFDVKAAERWIDLIPEARLKKRARDQFESFMNGSN